VTDSARIGQWELPAWRRARLGRGSVLAKNTDISRRSRWQTAGLAEGGYELRGEW